MTRSPIETMPTTSPRVDDRDVADPTVGHQRHAFVDRRLRRRNDQRRRDDLPNGGVTVGATLERHTPKIVALGDDAGDLAAAPSRAASRHSPRPSAPRLRGPKRLPSIRSTPMTLLVEDLGQLIHLTPLTMSAAPQATLLYAGLCLHAVVREPRSRRRPVPPRSKTAPRRHRRPSRRRSAPLDTSRLRERQTCLDLPGKPSARSASPAGAPLDEGLDELVDGEQLVQLLFGLPPRAEPLEVDRAPPRTRCRRARPVPERVRARSGSRHRRPARVAAAGSAGGRRGPVPAPCRSRRTPSRWRGRH